MPFYIRVPSLITPVHCITQTEEPSKQSARFTDNGFTVNQHHVTLAKIGDFKVVWSRPLSVISYQLSVISYQSSGLSFPLVVISYQLSGLSFPLVLSSGKFGAFFSLITGY
jgi:hypothetical protein